MSLLNRSHYFCFLHFLYEINVAWIWAGKHHAASNYGDARHKPVTSTLTTVDWRVFWLWRKLRVEKNFNTIAAVTFPAFSFLSNDVIWSTFDAGLVFPNADLHFCHSNRVASTIMSLKQKSNLNPCVEFFLLILVTAIGGRPKPELCFLAGQLKWTFLPKERYGNSLSGRGSNNQASNWEWALYHWAIVAPQKSLC